MPTRLGSSVTSFDTTVAESAMYHIVNVPDPSALPIPPGPSNPRLSLSLMVTVLMVFVPRVAPFGVAKVISMVSGDSIFESSMTFTIRSFVKSPAEIVSVPAERIKSELLVASHPVTE